MNKRMHPWQDSSFFDWASDSYHERPTPIGWFLLSDGFVITQLIERIQNAPPLADIEWHNCGWLMRTQQNHPPPD